MKKRKIIHIYHRDYNSYFPSKDSPYYYLAGWSSAVARQTVKYTNKYIIENWRPEREIMKPVICEVQGIKCRLFPSKYIKHFSNCFPTMLKELKKQAKENEILIHHSGIHISSLYLIAHLFKNVPIVAQQHGDFPALMRFKRTKKVRTLLSYFIEKKALRNVDHFFVLRKWEMEFLSRFLPKSCITLQTMGVDFDEFKPINKELAKEKLSLHKNKKIIIYIGKFYKLKGVDIILKVFQDLKKKYDIELVLIGGSSKDCLYEDVKSSGARFYGYLPHSDLPLYLSAANVYVLPAFSSYYRGIDVSLIESLACGTPAVSNILKDFPAEEWEKFGKIPKDKENVAKSVSEIFDNPESFKNCRKIAKKYFDWKTIIHRTVEVYDRLFEEYYEADRFFKIKQKTEILKKDSLNTWENFYTIKGKEQVERAIDSTWITKTLDIENNDYVLQLGCGTGDHIPGILKMLPGIKAFGIEISKTAIELRTTSNILRADIRFLPFKSSIFTKLFAFGVVEHVPEIKLVISEIARISKKGAMIYLTVPNKISFFHIYKTFLLTLDSLHLRRKKFWKIGYEKSFTLGEFIKLLRKEGFKILEYKIIPSSDINLHNPFQNISAFIHTLDYMLNKIKKNIFGFFIEIKAQKI